MADTTGKSQKGAKDAAETTTPAESQAVEKAVQDASKASKEAKTYTADEFNDINDQLATSNSQFAELQIKYDDISSVVNEKNERIAELESALESANKAVQSLSDKENIPAVKEKSVIVAIKDGIEREFPLLAWKNMPKDKGGWKQKVEAPKEAK